MIGSSDGYRHKIARSTRGLRIESPRLIAGLVPIVRDVGVAEDLAQDALVAALEQSFYKTASAGSGTSGSVSSLSTDTGTCVRATSI